MLVLAFTGTGCGKFFKKDKDAKACRSRSSTRRPTPSMSGGNWDRGRSTFRRSIAQYPYGPYTEQALMETAYAQYKAGKLDDAISTIDRFIRTYPTHRNVALHVLPARPGQLRPRHGVPAEGVAPGCQPPRPGDAPAGLQRLQPGRRALSEQPLRRRRAPAHGRRCATSSPATSWTPRCTTCAAAPGCRPPPAPSTCWKPIRRANTRTTPSPCWPRPTPSWATRPWPPTPSRVLQQNDPQHPWLSGNWPDYPSATAQAQPVRRREVGSGHQDEGLNEEKGPQGPFFCCLLLGAGPRQPRFNPDTCW